ncbi:hypothetical protein GNF10_05100 [Nostoc sp. UCD121]|uniref:hypothetical protein n=1 Tax=unclassified Nostoc TaxID=2593658 RepID=UPI0016240ED6|nr:MULTISPECIES: hypothetical protein [unclassified Nostoc]MBC1222065.1 hypothetical protein [Nostoc sp. UCD120]MBC1275373.1 hypothetical protein [Nostoc sp. UCD121]MBC1293527.1 hypothetical protein [Nostoc sp. UCD122]
MQIGTTVILLCHQDKISRPDAIAKKIAEYYYPALEVLPVWVGVQGLAPLQIYK